MNVDDFYPEFSADEQKVIQELSQKMDISYYAVLRQGLRILQLIQVGSHKLVEVNPMPKMEDASCPSKP